MSDFFRILRGLEINESARILTGSGAPGSTADTDDAQVGSLYLDAGSGAAWSKVIPGTGPSKWSSVGQILYSERPVSSPTLPAPAADNSLALGSGAQTAVGADRSIAIGDQSLARHMGAMVFANGRFGSSGDVQSGRYLLRTHTTSATPIEAFLDGTSGTARLVLPDNCTWTFKATVTAHRTDVNDGHAGYEIRGVVFRNSGAATISFQGSPIRTVLAESNSPWDINITPDPTTGALKITVTGQAGKTIRWAILIDTLEVTN